MKNTGGSAFPICIDLGQGVEWHKGMTLRDWFAGNAMQSLMLAAKTSQDVDLIANASYAMADAMIAERIKQ